MFSCWYFFFRLVCLGLHTHQSACNQPIFHNVRNSLALINDVHCSIPASQEFLCIGDTMNNAPHYLMAASFYMAAVWTYMRRSSQSLVFSYFLK